LQSEKTGKNIKVDNNGDISADGGNGDKATFIVHAGKNGTLRFQNVHHEKYWLRIEDNGDVNARGGGGDLTQFKVVQHGGNEISLNGHVANGFIGFKDNGKPKNGKNTGSGKPSRIRWRLANGNGGGNNNNGDPYKNEERNIRQELNHNRTPGGQMLTHTPTRKANSWNSSREHDMGLYFDGNNGWMEWDFDLQHGPGSYWICAQICCAEARPLNVYINHIGESVRALGNKTGGWKVDSLKWHMYGPYNFSQRRTSLRFDTGGPFPHFKRIAVMPSRLQARSQSTGTRHGGHQNRGHQNHNNQNRGHHGGNQIAPGMKVLFKFGKTQKNLKCDHDGNVTAKGGDGKWCQFNVHSGPNGTLRFQNVGNQGHWLRIEANGNINGRGAGGNMTQFKITSHGGREISLHHPQTGGHIGFFDNGEPKDGKTTGAGANARFHWETK